MVILNAKTPWIVLVCKQALYLGDVVESHARATRERRWSPLEIESLLVGKTTFLSTELTTKKIRPFVLWCYLLVFTKTALFFIFENASLLNIPVCRKKEMHKRLQMRWQTHHNCFRKTGEFTIFFPNGNVPSPLSYLECRSRIGTFHCLIRTPARKKCMLLRSHFLTAPVWKKKVPKGFFAPIYHFYIDHKASCLPSNILLNHCFQFLLVITVVSREIEHNGYTKF